MPAPNLLPRRVFVGAIITSRSPSDLLIIERGILGVGSGGVIRFVEDLDLLKARETTSASAAVPPLAKRPDSSSNHRADDDRHHHLEMPTSHASEADEEERLISKVLERNGWKSAQCKLVRIPKGSFLCPGFIDTHTHACQVPNIGLGQQYELLDWLQHVTFPRERRFEDARYARKTYESVVQRLIDSGTTTACYYATLHLEATKILAEICNERGQRAFVGKCQMDRNSPIDYVEKNASMSMEDTKEFIRFTRNLRPYGQPPDVSSPRIGPIDSLSGSSPEMDASIARLSLTVDEILSPQATKQPLPLPLPPVDPSLASSALVASSPIEAPKPLPASSSASSSPIQQHATLSPQQHRGVVVAPRAVGALTTPSASGSSTPPRHREREIANALVQPILTPRFAISCTDAMLTGISALLSRDPTLRVQTHLSENEGEIEFTKQLFPFAKTYTSVYDHYSLLGPRTILAHAIHLDADELEIIRKRRCGISHCPTSNLNLRSGASRVGEMLNMGIKVGLGTDVSGGFGLGMLSAVREASVVAKVLAFQKSSEAAKDGQATDANRPDLSKPPPTTTTTTTSAKDERLIDGRYPRPPVEGQYKPRKTSQAAAVSAVAALNGSDGGSSAHKALPPSSSSSTATGSATTEQAEPSSSSDSKNLVASAKEEEEEEEEEE
ncbi:hypothetical protein IE53DRAFT_391275, partial [Violaceomyces palustris]